MACTRQTHLGQQWLRLRKEQGTIACLEKVRGVKTVCDAEDQGKTCMAKAKLPEPQFAAAYDRGSVAERLTRHIGWREDRALRSSSFRRLARVVRESAHPAHPQYRGASERTRRLNTSHLPVHVIAGCPAAGTEIFWWPVWARSRRSTQTPGVMSGTTAKRWAGGFRNKHGATRANIQETGGRTAATAIQQPATGCANAARYRQTGC
jgi:hypothetical protein